MFSYSEALELLLRQTRVIDEEQLDIHKAAGRVAARDVFTPRLFPDTPRSAVDGFALDTLRSGRYALNGVAAAGEAAAFGPASGCSVAVMTGATVPERCCAVVRVEDVEQGEDFLLVRTAPEAGMNINPAGGEAPAGALILSRGTRISPVAHSVLCYTGLDSIRVHRRPRIGILTTGDELLAPGESYRKGLTFDSNSWLLRGLLDRLELGCRVYGPAADQPSLLARQMEEMTEECDLIVTAGGVSRGCFDYVRATLMGAGYEALIDRTRIKPGRPLIVAARDDKLFFGMPGYPTAFLVNCFVYLLPMLRKMMGLANFLNRSDRMRLQGPIQSRAGRCDFVRVKIHKRVPRFCAEPLPSQLTSHYLNFTSCDGLAVVEPQIVRLLRGEYVDVIRLEINGDSES